MNDLSPEAKALVQAGRAGFRPTDEDRARVLASLGAVAGASTFLGATALGASAFSARALRAVSWLLRTPGGWSALAVSVVGVCGLWALGRGVPKPAGVPAQNPLVDVPSLAVSTSAVDPSPPNPDAITAPTVALEPSATAGTSPAVDSDPPTRPRFNAGATSKARLGAGEGSDQLREEVTLLSKAESELYGGHARQALDTLAEHEHRFRKGALVEERMAARARALCVLGRRSDADNELELVERLYPSSAYLERAREACANLRQNE